jgi:hypothetical protein
MDAYEIAHSLMARPIRNRDGWLILCPCHGDKKPSLSIKDEGGKILLKCFAGCEFSEIRGELQDRGLWGGEPSKRPPVQVASPPKDRSDLLDRIWSESRLIDEGSVVYKYLASREIVLQEGFSDLREHPGMAVYEDGKRTGQTFPGIVAIIRNWEGRPAGLHLTFLEKDGTGKAPIESPRRIIGLREGSTRGGFVRLMEPKDGIIGIGEGLESTLSASILTGIPGWSALTAGGIERAVLPPGIRKVVIFADRDRAGLKSAAMAHERFKRDGRESEILAPDGWKMDFNDCLQKENARSVAS